MPLRRSGRARTVVERDLLHVAREQRAARVLRLGLEDGGVDLRHRPPLSTAQRVACAHRWVGCVRRGLVPARARSLNVALYYRSSTLYCIR